MGIEFNNQQIYALYDIENWWHKSKDQVYELSGAAGTGKAQPITTIIPTPDGDKYLGDIKVGDYVFNAHGKPVEVLGVYDQGVLDSYLVSLDDGRCTECNDEHLWTYYFNDERITTTLKELMKNMCEKKCYIPMNKSVEFAHRTFHTSDLTPYEMGLFLRKMTEDKFVFSDRLNNYLYMDKQQRCLLLKGFMNKSQTSALIPSDEIVLSSFSKTVIYFIRKVLNSLGYTGCIIDTHTRFKKGKLCTYYSLFVDLPYTDEFPYMSEYNDKNDVDTVGIKYVMKLNKRVEMRCIKVDDPENLYLTNDFIVTHNTTLIKYFIERVGLELSEVAFVAYMGKASMVMARSGLPAQTIHSLIYDYEKVLDLDENGKIQLNEKGKVKTKFQFIKKDRLFKDIKLIVLDEASMVNSDIGMDLLSYGIPLIALGDLNQLPPVFGQPFFLNNPNYILTQVMRQQEGNPIVWLAHRVLNGYPLQPGVYGTSSVIAKSSLNDFILNQADIVLTATNKLRHSINELFREEIRPVKKLELPERGEKIICRRNNWNRKIKDSIYLTNGTTGTIEYIDMETFDGKKVNIDFKPDFLSKSFKNVPLDYKRLMAPLDSNVLNDTYSFTRDQFEFAYAITTHLSQGSSYNKVLFLSEPTSFDKDTYKKLQYTAITRAIDSICIVQ